MTDQEFKFLMTVKNEQKELIDELEAKLSQAEADKAELVKRIKELNRYSFLSGGPNGGVRLYMDKSGSWVEYHEVIKLLGDDA